MAYVQCDSCEEIRQNAPNLITNGFTDQECENLANGKGLGGDGDNCEDMHNMNDCFIGMMDNEVDAYDNCDWKKFMHNFIPNIWSVIKGIICWLCGTQCQIDHLFDGANLYVSEDSSDGSYIVPGGGVSFQYDSDGSSERISDVTALYIGGALLRVEGTFRFFTVDFTDKDGTARQGNHHWGETGACVAGGERICEIRIKKSQYAVKHIYAGIGHETGGGGYHINATVFSEGQWAYGNHGACYQKTEDGHVAGQGHPGCSDGHLVPSGYIYIQLRMSYILALSTYDQDDLNSSGKPKSDVVKRYSPRALMGIRFNQSQIEC